MTWESGECRPPGFTFTISPADAAALTTALARLTEGVQAMAVAWAEAAPLFAEAVRAATPALAPAEDDEPTTLDALDPPPLRVLPGGDQS